MKKITTTQMMNAPYSAIYVWVNSDYQYPRNLAASLGRYDLKFMCPDDIKRRKAQGLEYPIVIDHATQLDWESMIWINMHNARYHGTQ